MKIRRTIAASAVLLAAMGVSAANADTVYTYTGNPGYGTQGDQYYVSATVDLNCVGSCYGNTYDLGAGLDSFTLSIDSVLTNASVFSVSSSSITWSTDGVPVYLTLSNAGFVTNWQVYLDDFISGGTDDIYTIGNDPIDGTSDNYAYGLLQSGTGPANPGTWSPSPVPEPGTLALFGMALLALGGLSLRKKST